MKLGINMPTQHPGGRPFSAADIMVRAKAIEDAGFDCIWLGESLNRGHMSMDPMAVLLLCAAATTRIEVGTAVFQVPLRNPADIALKFLTLHALTQGRFIAGVGAGSTEADFIASGVDYSQRFKLFASYLPLIRRFCRGETVDGINLTPPEAIKGGPPILIGAWASGIWVKRAARDYDGWLASGKPGNQLKTLSEGMDIFRELGGKRAVIATVTVNLSMPTTPLSPDESFNLSCAPDEAASRLQQLAELGFDDVHMIMPQGQRVEDLAPIRALFPRE